MRQTIVLTFDPQMGSFTVTANSAKILRDATFAQAVSHMAKAVKQAQGDKAPEGLDAFIITATEENLAVALPIPEPEPLKDAVGTVIETPSSEGTGSTTEKSPEQTAWESGTEKGEDGDKEAPVETQPETIPDQDNPTPAQEPEQIQPDSPATVHDGEVAVAAT
jgi:hypothetical protein